MKVGRQSKILELIGTYDIETQEELAELLTKAGYHVTQATISRDIRELKLTKAVSAQGKQKYIALKGEDSNLNGKYIRILKDAFISMNKAQNIMVIKTVSGMAMAAAAALDILNIEGIVGSIAGDDTIMCAITSEQETVRVMERLNRLLNEKA